MKKYVVFFGALLFPLMVLAGSNNDFIGGGGGGSVDLSAPGAIGGTTPAAGAFTTLDASGAITGASLATDRTDNPQSHQFYEATSDGDSSATFSSPAKATGYLGNSTVYLPDYSGGTGRVPLLVGRTRTAGGQNLTAASTVDVTGSTIVIPASTFVVGKQLRWVVYGRIAGTTGAKAVTLTDGTHTISVSVGAAGVGTFRYEFCFSEVTALTAQHMFASGQIGLVSSVTTSLENDLAMNTEVTVKLTMTLANAADDIYIDGVDVYFDQI